MLSASRFLLSDSDVHILKFVEMLTSIEKFAGFLAVTTLTALAIFLQYYRKRTGAQSVAVSSEVIHFNSVRYNLIRVILEQSK